MKQQHHRVQHCILLVMLGKAGATLAGVILSSRIAAVKLRHLTQSHLMQCCCALHTQNTYSSHSINLTNAVGCRCAYHHQIITHSMPVRRNVSALQVRETVLLYKLNSSLLTAACSHWQPTQRARMTGRVPPGCRRAQPALADGPELGSCWVSVNFKSFEVQVEGAQLALSEVQDALIRSCAW
jgi:hypothetical protein